MKPSNISPISPLSPPGGLIYANVEQAPEPGDIELLIQQEQPINYENMKIEKPLKLEKEMSNENKNSESANLCFELIPRYKSIRTSKMVDIEVPVLISLNAKLGKQEESKANRVPMDLIFVIDISGSMAGAKLDLVRKSMRYVLKVLNENDRICIITFNNSSFVLTPWLRNTIENKPRFKKIIKKMEALGGTNIGSGMKNAFIMLKKRKWKNPLSFIFLLSDGQDAVQNADKRIQEEYLHMEFMDSFIINTFGYGNEHDANVMLGIAKIKNGAFYFIQDFSAVSKYFLLSISGLMGTYLEDIIISFQEQKPFYISKVYGENKVWFKNNIGENIIKIGTLAFGDNKEFICEVGVPKMIEERKDFEKCKIVLSATCNATTVKEKSEFVKFANLELELLNPEESVYDILENPIVEINYLKAKAADVIGKACMKAEANLHQEAIEMLDDFIKVLANSKYSNDNKIVKLIQECMKSKENCKPEQFAIGGKAILMKNEMNNLQRKKSCSNLSDCNEMEKEVIQAFDKGELALSVSDKGDDDYQKNAFSDEKNQSHSSRSHSQDSRGSVEKPVQAAAGNLSVSSDDENEKKPKIEKKEKKIKIEKKIEIGKKDKKIKPLKQIKKRKDSAELSGSGSGSRSESDEEEEKKKKMPIEKKKPKRKIS